MKIILNEHSFELIPEGHADKMYIAKFIKDYTDFRGGNKNVFIEANFSYSDERDNNKIKGGGYCDPDKIVEDLFDADDEDEDKIAVCEIESLYISSYPL